MTRDGSAIRLSPKAYDLLLVLVANRQRALSKPELQQRLWPSTFVEETNLASLVAEMRRALDDDAHSPTFIRTVYGYGYQFIAHTSEERPPRRAAPPRMRPFVVVGERQVALADDDNIIGRAEDAAILIDSPGVSRHHARIVVAAGEATLEDLGSKNGTFVGSERVTAPRRLTDGDDIRVGPVIVTFRAAPAARSTATVF